MEIVDIDYCCYLSMGPIVVRGEERSSREILLM